MNKRQKSLAAALVYSGESGGVAAATKNAVAVTLVDVRLDGDASFEQQLPSSYNGFLVVIEGQIEAGDTATVLTTGKVGWTHPLKGEGASSLKLKAGSAGARVLIYAGQPQNIPVVAQGPFIAGSKEELAGYYAAYRQGRFPHAGSMRPHKPASGAE